MIITNITINIQDVAIGGEENKKVLVTASLRSKTDTRMNLEANVFIPYEECKNLKLAEVEEYVLDKVTAARSN